MKRILPVFFLLISLSASAQWRLQPYTMQYHGIKGDSVVVPAKTAYSGSLLEDGAIRYLSGTPQLYKAGVWLDYIYSGGTYTNPSWISSLVWSKITGTPTTLAGYGITNPAISTNSAIITNIGPTAQGQNHFALNNGGVNRIGLGLITTESGGNTGSNFYISRYNDAGVSTGFPFTVRRTDGRSTFEITPYVNNNPIWHAGNQGAGTGMDADLLDGQHGTYYLDFSNQTNKPGLNTVMDVSRIANDPNEYTIIGNVSIGKSATGYGTIGYGFVTTSSANVYNYANSDVAVQADFLNGDFNIRSAPVGTMGNPITFVDRFKVNNTGSVDVKGTSASVGNAFSVSNGAGTQLLGVANNGTVTVNGLLYASGSGSPESVITAPVGSWYSDLTNGIPYFKKTGSGNTGWKAVTLAP